MLEIVLVFGFILGCFGLLLLVHWLDNRGPVLTGAAMVVSRRVEIGKFSGGSWRNSGWNYLVTFRLTDGSEIELYTFENIYGELKEGMTGWLRWHKDSLTEFTPDKEVAV